MISTNRMHARLTRVFPRPIAGGGRGVFQETTPTERSQRHANAENVTLSVMPCVVCDNAEGALGAFLLCKGCFERGKDVGGHWKCLGFATNPEGEYFCDDCLRAEVGK